MLRLRDVPPNYTFCERFKAGDVALDIGVGDNPDFSKHLIMRYRMECFAVDPTRKHSAALR
jgi:hypothetical protein